MAGILCLGDNTVDIYVDRNVQYPGGNTVNVAVYCKQLGAEAGYLGCVGRDTLGGIVVDALQSEQIDISRLQYIESPTSWSRVRHHRDGDRYFDGNHLYRPTDYDLREADYAYIGEFDLVHSSINSRLESELANISAAAKILSFDFSDKFSDRYLEDIAPCVDVAFLSAADLSENDIEELCRATAYYGPETVVVTRGSKGAMCYHDDELYSQSIIDTDVVDTLGAGDGFISGFLVARLNGAEIPQSMERGAQCAAVVCSLEGAFGHRRTHIPGQPGLDPQKKA